MLEIEVITPERIVHRTQGKEVVIPTVDGFIGVRPGHLPLIAPLKTGQVVVKSENNQEEYLIVQGGFVEVLPDKIRIMADSAEREEERDEFAVQEAIKAAQKLKNEAEDKRQFAAATALIEFNLARLKLTQRKKYRGGMREVPRSSQHD